MNQGGIFPRGEKASSGYFTGTAWVNILAPKDWRCRRPFLER